MRPFRLMRDCVTAAVGTIMTVSHSQAVEIVTGGQPTADIVIPDQAVPGVQYAAKELQTHIEAATGARLTILRESSKAESKIKDSIYLGETQAAQKIGMDFVQLPVNSFQMLATGDSLFLAGRDGAADPLKDDTTSMGTLFAVYRWLDEDLHVRWLWPGKSGTVIPKTGDIAVAASEKREIAWSIHSRFRNWVEVDKMPLKDRETYFAEVNAWMLRQLMARPADLEYGHAYGEYWNRFGEAHPEYFALKPDGKRGPIDERTNLVQMCVSNPGLQDQIIQDWLVQKEKDPQRPWVNGIENDRRVLDPYCVCEKCLAWDAPTTAGDAKSYSDRYARFWLALQEGARKHTPEPKVIGYAYTDYAEAPAQTALNSDIIVGIVPSYRYPTDSKTREKFRTTWGGWKNSGATLYLRPNYFLFGYTMPYIFARDFGEDFKFALDHGAAGTDFDSLTGMWGVQGPNLYMLGRLHSRPDLSVDSILDEYYSGFGPAKEQVRSYFEYWEEITKNFVEGFEEKYDGGWAMVSKAGDVVYTPEVLAKGQELLEQAAKAAENAPEAAARVNYLQIWLKHAELSMDTLRAYHAMKDGDGDTALNRKFGSARVALDKFRKAHKEEFSAANLGLTQKVETWSGWRTAD